MKAFLIFVAMIATLLAAGCVKPRSSTSASPPSQDENGDIVPLTEKEFSDWKDEFAKWKKEQQDQTESLMRMKSQPTPVDYSAEITALQEQGARIEKSLSEKPAVDLEAVAMRADLKILMEELAAEKQAKADAAKEKEEAEAKLVRPSPSKGGAPIIDPSDGGRIRNEGSINLTDDGRLIVYAQTRPDCDPCVAWKAEGSGVNIDGQPVWWEDMSKCPKDFQITGFPFFAWRDSTGFWWTRHGWWGVENFEQIVNKANSGQVPKTVGARQSTTGSYGVVAAQKTDAPVVTYGVPVYSAPPVRTVVPAVTYAAPVVRTARVHYPIRGNWWSGCDSWHHLTSGVHAGYFDSTWLASLSWSEVQSLHSDHHEEMKGTGRVHWSSVVRPGQSMMRTTAVAAAGGATYGPSQTYSATYLPTYSSSIVYGSAYDAPVYSAGVYGAGGATYGKVQTRTTGAFGLTSRTKTVTGSAGVGVNAYGAPVAMQKSRTRTTTGLFGVPMTSRTRTTTRGSSCPGGVCPPAMGIW